jgi:nitrile hydratase beta subunit
MDGVHDLGGKQGFGPIDVNEPETPFHADWEGRMWAIAQCGGGRDGWTIDWWRHCRELIDPVDYLSRAYFDSWAQTYIAAHIDSGDFSIEEICTAKSDSKKVEPPAARSKSEVLDDIHAQAIRFDREIEQSAIFQPGDKIQTKQLTTDHHTRLPAYARGKPGVIHAHNGAHLLADAGALGEHRPEHIYSVVFEAKALWPEAQDKKDRVFIDLWESYLEHA